MSEHAWRKVSDLSVRRGQEKKHLEKVIKETVVCGT